MAGQYLKIISLGLIFTFLYNILSAGLRSIGDSRAPLYVLCITTVLHVLLAVYLVGKLQMGVQGAAYATVLSQAVSSFMLIAYIRFKVPLLNLTLSELRMDMSFLKQTIDFSSISALQQTVLYIGRLLVQSGINTLGVDAVAAFNAVSIIDSYILAPGDSLAASITTFTAQNKGGKQYSRIPAGLKTVIIMAEIYIVSISALVLAGRYQLLGIFLKPGETEAIRIGILYIVPMACFYFISGLTNSFQGYFRGIGNLKVTLIATVIQIPIRVILTYTLLGRFGIQSVVIGTTIGWLCMTAYELFCYRKWKLG